MERQRRLLLLQMSHESQAEIDINLSQGFPDGDPIKYTDENLQQLENGGLMKPLFSPSKKIDTFLCLGVEHHDARVYEAADPSFSTRGDKNMNQKEIMKLWLKINGYSPNAQKAIAAWYQRSRKYAH